MRRPLMQIWREDRFLIGWFAATFAMAILAGVAWSRYDYSTALAAGGIAFAMLIITGAAG